jgi:hypothetical protein
MSKSTAFILLVIVCLVWSVLFGGRLPKQFHARSCQGRSWRNAFPSASKQEIREFLIVFINAFAFSKTEKLKLNPNDKILQIYQARYPSQLMPDALELETLAVDLEKKYCLNFERIWSENLTLGELFTHVQLGHKL